MMIFYDLGGNIIYCRPTLGHTTFFYLFQTRIFIIIIDVLRMDLRAARITHPYASV